MTDVELVADEQESKEAEIKPILDTSDPLYYQEQAHKLLSEEINKLLSREQTSTVNKIKISTDYALYLKTYEAYSEALKGQTFTSSGTTYMSQSFRDIERAFNQQRDIVSNHINQAEAQLKGKKLNAVKFHPI